MVGIAPAHVAAVLNLGDRLSPERPMILGRGRQQDRPAGFEQHRQVADQFPIVLDVLDRLEDDDLIESAERVGYFIEPTQVPFAKFDAFDAEELCPPSRRWSCRGSNEIPDRHDCRSARHRT